MSGNQIGARKAAITNKKLYGNDFYAMIGGQGGRNGHTGGFAANVQCKCKLIKGEHLLRYCAGKKGGIISRRGPVDEY